MLDGISSSRQGWVLQKLGFQGLSHEPQHPLNKLSLVAFFEWKMNVGLVRGFCCGSNWARFSFPLFFYPCIAMFKIKPCFGDGEECYLTSATTLVSHWLCEAGSCVKLNQKSKLVCGSLVQL